MIYLPDTLPNCHFLSRVNSIIVDIIGCLGCVPFTRYPHWLTAVQTNAVSVKATEV